MNGSGWPGGGSITWSPDDAGRPFTTHEFKLTSEPDRPLTPDDLVFAATDRCRCGAGYCYPKALRDPHGSWYCSACIIGAANAGSEHDAAKPFAFWNIKGEGQPSANGATTRPLP